MIDQEKITDLQRQLQVSELEFSRWRPPMSFDVRFHSGGRKRVLLRRKARWWELEATRGYASSADSARYAADMRWLVELLDSGINIDRPFHVLLKERAA